MRWTLVAVPCLSIWHSCDTLFSTSSLALYNYRSEFVKIKGQCHLSQSSSTKVIGLIRKGKSKTPSNESLKYNRYKDKERKKEKGSSEAKRNNGISLKNQHKVDSSYMLDFSSLHIFYLER